MYKCFLRSAGVMVLAKVSGFYAKPLKVLAASTSVRSFFMLNVVIKF
jgi:hypothetical protein